MRRGVSNILFFSPLLSSIIFELNEKERKEVVYNDFNIDTTTAYDLENAIWIVLCAVSCSLLLLLFHNNNFRFSLVHTADFKCTLQYIQHYLSAKSWLLYCDGMALINCEVTRKKNLRQLMFSKSRDFSSWHSPFSTSRIYNHFS